MSLKRTRTLSRITDMTKLSDFVHFIKLFMRVCNGRHSHVKYSGARARHILKRATHIMTRRQRLFIYHVCGDISDVWELYTHAKSLSLYLTLSLVR